MNIEKEIKFYTAMYKEFYDFVKNDKKRSTTFMNQSKKLFPSENVEKLITPKELMLLVGYYSNIINELGYRSRIPLEDKELWISKLEDAFLSFMEETGYFEVS